MEAFYGMIATFGFTFAPRDWAFCSGQTVAISQNPTLYSLIGTFYGGDGRTNFKYPDLRARMAVGSASMGPPLGLTFSYPLGELYGSQIQSLNVNNLPSHDHVAVFTPTSSTMNMAVKASTDAATKRAPDTGDYLASQPQLGTFPDMYVDGNAVGASVSLGGVSASLGLAGEVSVGNTGNGTPFEIVNPLQAVNFCICEDGLYPSRN